MIRDGKNFDSGSATLIKTHCKICGERQDCGSGYSLYKDTGPAFLKNSFGLGI
jgi:hypothetical protein